MNRLIVALALTALAAACTCEKINILDDAGTGGGANAGGGTGVGGGATGGANGGGAANGGGGGDAGSRCSTHQLACAGQCVEPRVDPDHCGGCTIACDAGSACSAGLCTSSCQAPLTICGRSCVDTTSDNKHCGGCASPCSAGMGCVDSMCRPAVTVGPAPAACANGGPPIFFGDAGTPDCAGNVAARTFRYALCSCAGLTLSNALRTDAYDSTQGPYGSGDAGLGGAVGTNGGLDSSGPVLTIGGTLWVSGSAGISHSNNLIARQELHCGGDWTTQNPAIGSDAYVNGNISVNGNGTIGGTLRLPAASTISGNLTTGSTARTTVNVGDACDCDAGSRVPVGAIVTARTTNNDNAAIGLDPAVFAGAATAQRLDLPCGNYYLSVITTNSPVTIVAHGNTALYVGGDVTTNKLQITLDPSAELDVFIAGSLCNSGSLRTGSPNYPSQMRIYVGGNNACGNAGLGIRFSGPSNYFAGNFYATNGHTASSPGTYYGAIAVGAYTNSSSTTIHYDKAVLGQGSSCPTDGGPSGCTSCRDCNNQACVNGTCGSCTSSSECCAPLICNQGMCVPSACKMAGQSCMANGDCCTSLVCVDANGSACSGGGACSCIPIIN